MMKISLLIWGVLVSVVSLPTALAAEMCPNWAVKLVSVQGRVEVKPAGAKHWAPGALEATYCSGVSILIGANSRAAVLLPNETLLRLDQHTLIRFAEAQRQTGSFVDLIRGIVNFLSREPRSFTVNTPYVNASIEGTEFNVAVTQGQTGITVFEGVVLAQNPQGLLHLRAGESATVVQGRAPAKVAVVRPRDVVQWALYYPPILDPHRPRDLREGSAGRGVRDAQRLFAQGDVTAALARLEEMPAHSHDSAYSIYRASLLLYVGRVVEAAAEIERVLARDPGDANAMALQAIIALVRNDMDRAQRLALQATRSGEELAAPRIALSYVRQAGFDLDGALASVRKAVDIEPDNALAWARIAELELAQGRSQAALGAARRAAGLSPKLARTQWILGFVYLGQFSPRQAGTAFAQAIALDSADPMARLGLGLVKIRMNELPQGRQQIEISALLDPNNAIIRSYLGKAYYEEQRVGIAAEQYAMAKRLDPNDPTPWFYDAIRKQAANRPVEALMDLQKSIKLNDNRGVYRSRLLLDDDLAARAVGVGNLYRDLGFDQLAANLAGGTINSNPDNYSAHRLLSDAYLERPRHEFARVSELFQSQMLQPININPLQPQAGETSLTLLDSLGPTQLTLNEYHSLFSRNRLRLTLNATRGTQDTSAYEGIVSGIHNNLSVSLGGYHYETEGYHDNNGFSQDLVDLFIQAALMADTSLFIETSSNDIRQGDSYRFDPDNFDPSLRTSRHIDQRRFGIRHALSTRSNVLFSLSDEQRESDTSSQVPGIPPFVPATKVTIQEDNDSTSGELGYLFKQGRLNLTAGVGMTESENRQAVEVQPSSMFFTARAPEATDLKERNAYVYGRYRALQELDLTLGLSVDSFENDAIQETDLDEVNPKFGLNFRTPHDTTLRAAYIETFRRSLLGGRTLEPTNVAGFNQFYDDVVGSSAKKYAVAVDQVFSGRLFAGLEASKRNLDVRYFLEGEERQVAWDEELVGAYLYWLPSDRISVEFRPTYETFDRDRRFTAGSGFTELQTCAIPIGVNYFDPSGWSSKARLSYIDQAGAFQDPDSGGFVSGQDSFWTVDLGLQYRLHEQRGLVSLEVRNLFDQDFRYQEVDENNPRIAPELTLAGRITLLF